jgi:hypothetical protein
MRKSTTEGVEDQAGLWRESLEEATRERVRGWRIHRAHCDVCARLYYRNVALAASLTISIASVNAPLT